MEHKGALSNARKGEVEEKKETIRKPLSLTMSDIMKKQAEDIRSRLIDYRVVSNRLSDRYNYNELPNLCNIILFGPSGSGKSSLIRTFYYALHNTRVLPKEIEQTIVVKGEKHNEGTTLFTGVTLKPELKRVHDTAVGKVEYTNSSIIMHDTRGQIWMDCKEMAQLELLIHVSCIW